MLGTGTCFVRYQASKNKLTFNFISPGAATSAYLDMRLRAFLNRATNEMINDE